MLMYINIKMFDNYSDIYLYNNTNVYVNYII